MTLVGPGKLDQAREGIVLALALTLSVSGSRLAPLFTAFSYLLSVLLLLVGENTKHAKRERERLLFRADSK